MPAGPLGPGPAWLPCSRTLPMARLGRRRGPRSPPRGRRGHKEAPVASRRRTWCAYSGPDAAFGGLYSRRQNHCVRPASITPLTSLRRATRLERGPWHARPSGQSQATRRRLPGSSLRRHDQAASTARSCSETRQTTVRLRRNERASDGGYSRKTYQEPRSQHRRLQDCPESATADLPMHAPRMAGVLARWR
jgi:hypothetical protein